MQASNPIKSKIVIVGGGFGGIRTALKLSRQHNLEITLISASDRFSYFPQLYHAATGGAPIESSIAIADILDGRSVKFIVDTIKEIDPKVKTITGSGGKAYHYDKLVLALGSVTNFFGVKGLKEFSFDIKTIAGAEQFKRHLHQELLTNKSPDPNYVVIGAGPTGVELAAALGPYLRRITKLHGIKKTRYNIRLIEAAPRVLPHSSLSVSRRVERQLRRLGVTVMTGQAVKGESADRLKLGDESLVTRTVVWTAGVSNNPFYAYNASHFTLDKRGHVQVDEHLEARPSVYVIGDNAAVQYAGMAQSALNHADFVASDLKRVLSGVSRRTYKPSEPISVIPVGPNWAAATWGKIAIYGRLGFWLRRMADLVGYSDIEPWPKAIRLWLGDTRREENCTICQGADGSVPADAKSLKS